MVGELEHTTLIKVPRHIVFRAVISAEVIIELRRGVNNIIKGLNIVTHNKRTKMFVVHIFERFHKQRECFRTTTATTTNNDVCIGLQDILLTTTLRYNLVWVFRLSISVTKVLNKLIVKHFLPIFSVYPCCICHPICKIIVFSIIDIEISIFYFADN